MDLLNTGWLSDFYKPDVKQKVLASVTFCFYLSFEYRVKN